MPYSLSFKDYSGELNTRKLCPQSSLPVISMPSVDNKSLLNNHPRDYDAESYDFAIDFECSINIKKAAVADSLSEGVLYRCAIESSTAFSIHVVFSKFQIPIGSKLFLYDESAKQIIGAFTSNNNKKNQIFAVAPIFSNKIVIEYFEPYFAEYDGILEIGHIYHGYINISEDIASSLDGTCEVDVNCSEGLDWQKEKRSVCKIIFGGYMCSGALINNTGFDGTPYFLTANHCISTEDKANICIFYFNYENQTCGINSTFPLQTISGSTLRATSSETDFTLLELLEIPNITFHPYYAGWDRNISHHEGGVGIHHPKGLPKKISTYEIAPKLVSCRYSKPENFYLIDEWIATEHGYGVTEGGSSGSPLFNSNHRIIGQLFGGCPGHNSNCDNPSNDYSVYGKFYLSWDGGTSAATRLKDWLDPTNKNFKCINGLDTCSSDILDISIHRSIEEDGASALFSDSYIESMATIDSGAVVYYIANDYILLNNGFFVQKGAEFYASISSTRCNSFAPISIVNWTPNITTENTLEYNVANATHYKIFVHSLSGDLVYMNQDTVLYNNIVVWQDDNLSNIAEKYLITVAFGNDYEEISNTFILDCEKNISLQKQVQNSRSVENTLWMNTPNLSFNISQNPANGSFEVEVVTERFSPYSVRIYSVYGQCVSTIDYINSSKVSLNLNDLPQGEYVLQVVMGSSMYSKKIVKF